MYKKVLVIAVHPDDETLGAGGTLLKHKAKGDEIHCIFCTDIFEDEGFSKEQIDTREQELQEISKSYAFTSIHRLGLKTTKIDQYSQAHLVSLFSQIFEKIKPNILYLPFAYDVHSDHRIIFQTAFSCTKSFRYPSIEKILMMETLSESEFAPALTHQSFIPNVFVDISDFLKKNAK
ncbi:hypothetical protein LOCUS_03230 [Campylobacter jejuni]|nr:hypothetical protein LOCUS_03230 [Campylobacter jejuni]